MALFKRFARSRVEPVNQQETATAEPSSFVAPDAPVIAAAGRQMLTPHRDIVVDIADPEIDDALIAQVIGQWEKLGSEQPFWSNCTSDKFRADRITKEAVDGFYERGGGTDRLLEAFESRSDSRITNGTCLDFGCGVGRIISPLAKRFSKVVGMDVSPALLVHCREHAREAGLTNVETAALENMESLRALPSLDFFISISVLQHNPPPLQKKILEILLGKLHVGGHCLFQTPDWLDGYSFEPRAFLENRNDRLFDLHCLPKPDVLRILRDNGMQLLDFAPEFELQQFGSYTYFAKKVG